MAPRRRFLRVEVLAGHFDRPRNEEQSRAEAAEMSRKPGGIFTFDTNVRQVEKRVRRYEREAIAYRQTAFETALQEARRDAKK